MKKLPSIFAFVLLLITGCSSVKKLHFKVPVDTHSRKIHYQKKQTYTIDDMGVSASNEFLTARLNGFKKENDSTVLVTITPENIPINNSAWYSFKIWSKQPKTIYLKFAYPEKYSHRYIPKIKQNNGTWKAVDTTSFKFQGKGALLKVHVTPTPLWISAQESISSKDTYQWVHQLIKNKPYVHVYSAGKSVLGKEIPVLDIYKGNKKGKPIVVLLTRQHPPELTGFIAFQSFLKTILEENNLSKQFLEKYRILVFPIVNPDGVDLGHWRHNAHGIDTNRDWSNYLQPEIKALTKYIVKTTKKDKTTVVLAIDFHSTQEDMYYTSDTRNITAHPDFIENWFAKVEKGLAKYHYKPFQERANSVKPVSKGWFLKYFKANAMTYEIGDETPRDFIKEKARVAAIAMMQLLNKW